MHAFRAMGTLAVLATLAACAGTDVTRPGMDVADVTPAAALATTVAATVGSITASPATATLPVGKTLQLGGAVKSIYGKDITLSVASYVTLASSDTSIATVSPAGIVTGKRNGKVTITATIFTRSSSSAITVGTGVASVIETPMMSAPDTTLTLPAPTPAPIVSPTTPLTSTPVPNTSGTSLTGVGILYDDYTRYSSTAALRANISTSLGGTGSPSASLYSDGAHGELAELDNTVKYNGHATVKYNQPGGTGATPELWSGFPGGKTLTKMWFRAKVRFSQGFTTTGTLTNSANAYKLFGWGWSGRNGRGSIEISNTNQYLLYWYVFSKTVAGQTVAGGNSVDAGLATTEWTDGQWYDYVIQYDQTSATSAVAKTWIQKDGQAFKLCAVSTGTGAAGDMASINSVMIGINFNQVRTASQTQAVWIGQWEVIDGSQYSNPFGIPGI